jgi:hypothetical protein
VNAAVEPWWRRIALAFGVFSRVLFDGRYAAAIAALRADAAPAPPQAPRPQAVEPSTPSAGAGEAELARAAETGAVVVLSLMQAEGRFIDFVQQDLTGFGDAEIGAVARVVHQGCGKILRNYLHIEAIRAEPEGQSLRLPAGFDPSLVKLTGNLGGGENVEGVLRHKGWLATEVRLPQAVDGRGLRVLCPAEIEL